ncbi:class I SAM-dependent methyltransferase [Streptomyces sp. NPDC047706]|uniref:class I SAM-dependent methyltransferase n=1 Tax=Streptomyces sp. NPDC047706 TaxID=3365486 RepID=UPI00371E8017
MRESLLIPLYARAVENRKEHALPRDTRAEETVAAIDYDFARFDGLPSLTGAMLRTVLFDRWVADFPSAHPEGTVVEIGTGLHTRHEPLDSGRARWFELDLPDVISLRRTFFADTPRRTRIAAGSPLALDTAGPGFFDTQEQHDALSKVEARMHRPCP